MAEITASMVSELRTKTGAGMMECKKALTESAGDMEKAVDVLRKRGLASAAKKSGRVASEGLVTAYLHGEGRIGVLLEVNCETDFVSRNEEFKNICKDLCLHIAAHNPLYVSPEEVPSAVIQKEKEIAVDQAKASGKPAAVLEKIAEGKVSKYYDETCLLEQGFVKDPDKKVKQILTEAIAKIGENIKVRRFTRYEMGEGLEKKQDNFAEEVAAQLKN